MSPFFTTYCKDHVQVGSLEMAVSGRVKVEEKQFVLLSELLMRDLLKLDSVEAEGEAKVQRKIEVSCVMKQ